MSEQLIFFPTPRPDELFFSVVARYHQQSGNTNCRLTKNQLFGQPFLSALVEVPTYLDTLVARLPAPTLLPAITLIREHTLLPYYIPFVPGGRIEAVMQQMRSGTKAGRGHGLSRLGQVGTNVPRIERLRYCPECMIQDRERYGESYWHRSHQIFGVFRCSLHGCWLHESIVTFRNGDRATLTPLERVSPHLSSCLGDTNEQVHQYDWLAQAVYRLLNGNQGSYIPSYVFQARYKTLLADHGLLYPGGNLDIDKFLSGFSSFYHRTLLTKLKCQINDTYKHSPILRMFHKNYSASNPLYHLLVMQFLGAGLESMLRAESGDRKPFGDGPWPCLNRSANHYREAVVDQCSTSDMPQGELVKGTFTCACGFIYERRGPDTSPSDRFRYDKIIATGDMWDKELQRLIVGKSSFRAAGRTLGVHQNVITQQVGRLMTYPSGIRVIDELLIKRECHRGNWINLCASYPDESCTEIRHRNTSLYNWLNNNDAKWFSEHKPLIVKTKKGKINWEQLDIALSKAVLATADEMKNYHRAITYFAIAKRLGKVSLIQEQLDKLPKTKAALASATETITQSVERRFQAAVADFQMRGEPLEINALAQAARVSPTTINRYAIDLDAIVNEMAYQHQYD